MKLAYHETVRIHHLAFRSTHVPTTKDFYERVLGMKTLRTTEQGSVWLATGDAVLMIEARGQSEPEIPAGSMEFTGFAVDALAKAHVRHALATSGVAIEHETEHTVYFRDPDGRRIGVSDYPL
jgi:catechol 2,3-dioxygenase-like lactoylglutathione lyase family enzyme